jgi:dTDP-4-dehydrorhamnose reductase
VKNFSRTLIGHTGFVGGSLTSQANFDGLFNRSNISDSKDTISDLLVCSAAPAQKWLANSNPQEDLENVQNLVLSLELITAKKAVLISTVDVFETPLGVDEDSIPQQDNQNAYGRNRRFLELEFKRIFQGALIIRLPGLVGMGLRKNALFDLKHDNQVYKLNVDSVFQFYPMENLWADISLAVNNDLRVLHLASEPVSLGEIAKSIFGVQLRSMPLPAKYDFQTKLANLWGKNARYQYSTEQTFSAIREYSLS